MSAAFSPGEMKAALRAFLGGVEGFAEGGSGLRLRRYQAEAARAVADSVLHARGLSLAVMFPRQSGKNELQAQLEAFFLLLFMRSGAEIVKVSPTWRPQAQNAMRRLERVLQGNALTRGLWRREAGYILRLGAARIYFFSAAPESNIVGATASTLLEVDEAQDVLPAKFDRDVAPMAASTNATRVFWGTAWTSQTLLGRELRACRAEEAQDGRRRVFTLTAEAVSAEVPAYGEFVRQQTQRLGRANPLVRTQLYNEEIDAEAGMFPPARLERIFQGPPLCPQPGLPRALLLDVAGEDETAAGTVRRDSTALSVVQVEMGAAGPVYRVIWRALWTGTPHTALFEEVRALAQTWAARRLVVDATGVGAGLASFLGRALPGRVLPFVFSAASKSRLGWDFLALVDAGRFGDPGVQGEAPRQAELRRLFRRQLELCRYEALPGPAKSLRWGVPDGTRDPLDGELAHDDLLLSAALCAALEGAAWGGGAAAVVAGRDPLRDMERSF